MTAKDAGRPYRPAGSRAATLRRHLLHARALAPVGKTPPTEETTKRAGLRP